MFDWPARPAGQSSGQFPGGLICRSVPPATISKGAANTVGAITVAAGGGALKFVVKGATTVGQLDRVTHCGHQATLLLRSHHWQLPVLEPSFGQRARAGLL